MTDLGIQSAVEITDGCAGFRVAHDFDEAIHLLNVYRLLEGKCERATDELEAQAADIADRVAADLLNRAAPRGSEACERNYQSDSQIAKGLNILSFKNAPLTIVKRADLSAKFGVPVHAYGNKCRLKGATDCELLALEAAQNQIQNYLDQMRELQVDIAVSHPTTLVGVCAKLDFLADMLSETTQLESDVVAMIVRNCASHVIDLSAAALKVFERSAIT